MKLEEWAAIATIVSAFISILSLIVTLGISSNVKKIINNSTMGNVRDKNVNQNITGNKNKTEVNIK